MPDRSPDSTLEEALRALNCGHNQADDEAERRRFWTYTEHEGETWNRCKECGLLELWAAGTFIRAALARGGGEPTEDTRCYVCGECKSSLEGQDV